MTMNDYYEMIFKRKSFHMFRGVGNDSIAQEELDEIQKAFGKFERLYPDIRTGIRILPADKAAFKKDAEYCILIYSEKKENYLMNAGFIGEQLDLWLVKHNIGSLWYGIGKPDEPSFDGMDYVIMIAIRKVNDDTKYRKDMFKAKRKPMEKIWSGDDPGIGSIARFAPSAVNSQPWYVENKDGVISVYRYRKSSGIGIMSFAAAGYFNRIDIGIYLCFLEICMQNKGITYDRKLFIDEDSDKELTLVAEYRI